MSELTVTHNRIIALSIILKDQYGQVLADNREGPTQVYRHGANMILPRLEYFLEGMREKEEAEFMIPFEQAFGPQEPGLLLFIQREDLEQPDVIREGDHICIFDGTEGVVTSVSEKGIIMDANHPLAGKDLHYHVRIVGIREATEEDDLQAPYEFGYTACSFGCAC
jgi:FKBP-type peptidyl-prolyl cis-trans isomerase SlyD